MPKMTLLEIVQNILSAMDSDEVNSINDTIESQQVSKIVEETFHEQFTGVEMPTFRKVLKIEGLSDLSKPNYLRLQDNVRRIEWLRYRDASDNNRYKHLEFYPLDVFFDRILNNVSTSDNVTLVTDESGVQYYIKNNTTPSYYTITDNNTLIFDSFDSAYDGTLQASKTFAYGTVEPTWSNTDEFIPPIESSLFPLLLAEAKSTSFVNVKQIASSKEEQRARRQRIRWQSDKHRDRVAQKYSYEGPNYARNRP